jgi:surface polysaccharide O-acyltransferase-like enzyme
MFVVWEQLVALSLIIALLGLFKRYFNAQNDLLKDLSQNSYAIYIFHGFVLIGFSALFQFYQSSSFLKFVLLLIPVLLFCYLLAKFVRSIPGIKKVL